MAAAVAGVFFLVAAASVAFATEWVAVGWFGLLQQRMELPAAALADLATHRLHRPAH